MRGMWWRRQAREVQVITRVGCHLCEDMVRLVQDVAGAGVPVATLDVDAALDSGELDPAQHARWTTVVPVLLVDGREIAQLHVDADQVRRALCRR